MTRKEWIALGVLAVGIPAICIGGYRLQQRQAQQLDRAYWSVVHQVYVCGYRDGQRSERRGLDIASVVGPAWDCDSARKAAAARGF